MRPGEKAILPLWFRTALVLAILATLYFSLTHRLVDNAGFKQVVEIEHGERLASQKLFFVDLEGGSVSVVDADTNIEITRLLKGESGFMRSVMRGFVRERRAHGIGPQVPFELAMWKDGLVSMIDPTTSRRVELSAFGYDNVKAFTRLIQDRNVVAEQSQLSARL